MNKTEMMLIVDDNEINRMLLDNTGAASPAPMYAGFMILPGICCSIQNWDRDCRKKL
ncbi:MAG TPA: hypothetical protein IAC99_01470 [Candidatus Choladocola avistercoris]|nr:hypothetical protein [Candidatus Choladocola avistercoris]